MVAENSNKSKLKTYTSTTNNTLQTSVNFSIFNIHFLMELIDITPEMLKLCRVP